MAIRPYVIRRGMPKPMRFEAPIKIRDGNPYILVSAARAKLLAKSWRKPLPVLIRINEQPRKAWRINMMPTGKDSFYLYLHGDARRASRTQPNAPFTAPAGFAHKAATTSRPAAFRRPALPQRETLCPPRRLWRRLGARPRHVALRRISRSYGRGVPRPLGAAAAPRFLLRGGTKSCSF